MLQLKTMDYNPHLPQILVIPSRTTGSTWTESSGVVDSISTGIPLDLKNSLGTPAEIDQYAGDYTT